jgi:hypothetical protein
MNIFRATIKDLQFLWAWVGVGFGNIPNLLFIDPTPFTLYMGACTALVGFLVTGCTLWLKIWEILKKRQEKT